MSTLPGTSCLLTDSEDLPLYQPRQRVTRPITGPRDPGDDTARAAHAQVTGRLVVRCTRCGAPLSELFTRRSKSGKTFCQPCADQTVLAYCAQHPGGRPSHAPAPRRELTGISYLKERERYEVRYHQGNARWQISDTQVQRWTSHGVQTEAEAATIAATMNASWRAQVEDEQRSCAAGIRPSTSPRHTWRVGERGYGREEA